jgi:hypothetical protein
MHPQTIEFLKDTVAFKSYFRGEAKGEARGRAWALVRVLAGRSFSLTDEQRLQIIECTDLDQLETWFDRALKASSLHDVLA